MCNKYDLDSTLKKLYHSISKTNFGFLTHSECMWFLKQHQMMQAKQAI